MARLLKSAYFKASSNTKFCSYATKTNPYFEILKTLKSWEQDLRNRNKSLPQHNDEGHFTNVEHLSSQCASSNNDKNLNVQHENLDLNEIMNAANKRTYNVTFIQEKSENLKENQEIKNKNENLFYKEENFRMQSAEFSSNEFPSLKIIPDIFHTQGYTESAKHIRDSDERTTNINTITSDSISQHTKKKLKHSKAKSSYASKKENFVNSQKLPHDSLSNKSLDQFSYNLSKKESIESAEHSEKNQERTTSKNTVNEVQSTNKKKSKKSKANVSPFSEKNMGEMSSPEHLLNKKSIKESAEHSEKIQERTTNKNTVNEVQRTNKKKSKKSKTNISQFSEKSVSEMSNPEHLLNKKSIKESNSLNEHSSHSNQLNEPEIMNFSTFNKEKSVSGEFLGKEFSKGKKKSKSKSKPLVPAMKEDQKQRFKQENAVHSLKSLMKSYIDANEINKVQKTFEYLLYDKKKKEFMDVELFNIIISGWAREGKLDKVKQLFFLMFDEKVSPNLQTYASYFEAIARSKCVDVAEVQKVIDEMKSYGLSPKELLQNCTFVGDQREKVIETLGFFERDLSLPLYVPEDAYSYKLLEKLNDKNYEKRETNFNFGFQAADIPKLSAAQLEIEGCSSIKIKSVITVAEPTDKVIKAREYLKECENIWRKRLTKVLNGFKTPKHKQQSILGLPPSQSIFPYLTVIDTEVLVNLLLQETRMLGETAEFYSPNIKHLYRDLGSKVMRLYYLELNKRNNITDKVRVIYDKYLNHLLDLDISTKYIPREYWEFLKSKYPDGPTIDVPNPNWPYSVLIFIGSILYDVLRSNICFNPNRITKKSDSNFMYPAFHVVYENVDVKLNRQIRAHDMFCKLYRDAKLEHLEFDVTLVPMLCPPHPWIKYDSGGLLITKIPFVRLPEYARSQTSFYSKMPSRELNACFDSLNNLSLCPWIINKSILDIVIKIFQDGGSEALDIPVDPKLLETTGDDEAKSSLKYKLEYEKKKCEMTSLWFDCLYKLSIANHFRDKVFWFPHNFDFRGRVYPTPPHFNHLGSDMSRSILLFAAGKPLGEKGLDWLKIHLINLTGFKKRATHAERLKYANEILPDILDSADNPFGEKKWWMKSDKPLQTLACCKEVANAVRHPNPSEYISNFPVHQDGSCNGLQHYAALGRDEFGAIEVNLHPSSSPQDVYSGVAALVEKERERDASMGLEIAQALEGFVTRKVVKQTVMTFVYGVTPYGARLQVLKQLKDMPEFPEEKYHVAATYLMKKIFLSIKEMFTATKKIQDWFTDCAEEITRVTEDSVEWVTPLGLPVIQPYYKETIVRCSKFCISKGNKENINHYVSSFEPYQLPNVRKQKNAFAPNFIHSLDSTHMMLTSLFCHRKGITFVSVHDCYWTHASTVQEMNKICRDQFVSLHSEPILENLSAFFLERYVNSSEKNSDLNAKQIRASSKMRDVLSAVPDTGTFDLKQVLNSEYFFS